ncbi:hypothetical protein [uncultured Thiodictyon sp.]|jgi:hypothetical protein|uniref:hypothetical protein n=1 Tax=uncultured Thiodictyon sp. TaxID=1846217 RepID=UPI0025ED67EE|nr:hypothetical protein [uncultured Thiodictyon sp.]
MAINQISSNPGTIARRLGAVALLLVLASLGGQLRFKFLLAGTLYIGGCIGFEMIGGAYDELHGVNNLTINIISNAEEGLEITGLIVFVYALLAYIREQYNEVLIRLV